MKELSGESIAAPPALEAEYNRLCREPSDINQHLPALRRLAGQCTHVTEFGVRSGVSTTALLAGQPKRLTCYDIVSCLDARNRLRSMRGRTVIHILKCDVLHTVIEETDMLFIDTLHTYSQLTAELSLHGNKATKYLVFHDTQKFGLRGEGCKEGEFGILQAINEFLFEHPLLWRIKEVYINNNGMMVLERK